MPSEPESTEAEPEPTLTCPQCGAPVRAGDATCLVCKVNLALAAVLVEREVLASAPGDVAAAPAADLILPRFGDFLVQAGYISQSQLDTALAKQRDTPISEPARTIGQILLGMGVVTREHLDTASMQQVKQLQTALLESNRELGRRVTQRTQELQQALQKLTELNQLKANFVANISHELRTPLSQIKGYVELLAEEASLLTSDQNDLVRRAERAVAQLEALIFELLEFSASARGDMVINAAAIVVPELVDQAVSASRPKADKRQIRLESQAPPSLPPAMADREKIHWVLFQLLDNAIKFTPPGGAVTVAADVRRGRIRLSVRDTGIGIASDRVVELFTPFHQLDGSLSRRYGGMGLGLALVKRILDAHESQIKVESQPEQGSTFSFDLPVAMSK